MDIKNLKRAREISVEIESTEMIRQSMLYAWDKCFSSLDFTVLYDSEEAEERCCFKIPSSKIDHNLLCSYIVEKLDQKISELKEEAKKL